MKKVHQAITAAFIFLLLTANIAIAAPGDYTPDKTSDKYLDVLGETSGLTDTSGWGADNDLDNANKTGLNSEGQANAFGDVIRNSNGQRVHGQFAINTNSCASCHQTHTASGRQLLFKNGVYNTCAACHDGTMGFYNVFAPSNAGTLGGNPDKLQGNASVHLATGVIKNSAAPGGNRSGTDPLSWGKEFTCSGCHSPHGSYSDRLLHYNPNAVGIRTAANGGNLSQNNVATLGTGGVWSVPGKPGPWIYGYNYGTPKDYWTKIKVNGNPNCSTAEAWNDVLQVNYALGIFTDKKGLIPLGATITVDIAPANVTKMNKTQTGEVAGIKIYRVDSYKKGVNPFCYACHTDYNSVDSTVPSGTYTLAFRHKVVQNLPAGMIGEEDAQGNPNKQMACLTCHYAHGTQKSIMYNTKGEQNISVDSNFSTALKRYVNMSVCWKCHTESPDEAIKGPNAAWDVEPPPTP